MSSSIHGAGEVSAVGWFRSVPSAFNHPNFIFEMKWTASGYSPYSSGCSLGGGNSFCSLPSPFTGLPLISEIGITTLSNVPSLSDLIRREPLTPACVPAFPLNRHLCRRYLRQAVFNVFGGIPCPLSLISNRTCLASTIRRISATELPECLWTLVRPSCKARNSAISTSLCNRSSCDGSSSFTLIPLRWPKPSSYHRMAEPRPASSNNGGCSRWEIVRVSARHLSTISEHSEAIRILWVVERRSRFIFRAVKYCPKLSCSPLAIRRHSSSCKLRIRALKLLAASSARFL
jgi:hypothetical protein